MKKLVLSAFLLAGFMFTSCDKNDDNTIVEEGTVDLTKMYLPLKMTADDYTTTFTYNNKGQVTKIVDTDGYEYTFTYNGNQLVSFEEIETDGKTTYTFSQNGNIITVNLEGKYGEQTYNDTHTLEVDANGNLIKDEYYTYTYDTAGNNIKMKADDEVATMTYDNKNGIFKNLNLPKWVSNYLLFFQSHIVNNAITFEFVSPEYPEDNNSATMVYVYNADGYPTKATATGTDEMSQTIEYTKK